ncbi:hypothetical protein PUMCH_001437 [Australozyma saopauloensis]|uniref:Mitochondrial group I intron splicing factor CCM1 n=1 Tax=Australozyma saopauloensis TaxID=291208 RepID=A0AAX4H7E9_9ASCO|nr:hypothetical protein PUMCH_001437 [[Candida] saopauloensis]
MRILRLSGRNFSQTILRPAQNSHIQWKLENFVETGEIKRYSDDQIKRRNLRKTEVAKKAARENGIGVHKALLLLRLKYDAVPLQTKDGEQIQVGKLKPNDIGMYKQTSKQLFEALSGVKEVTRKRIDDRILMVLMGVLPTSIKDLYFVTQDVIKLLQFDNAPDRAMELCRMAGENGAVGMNAILQWSLEKKDIKLANKIMSTRSKWRIPTTPYSHVIYFSGLADLYQAGLVPKDVAEKVFESVSSEKMPKRTDIFNAALKLLVKCYDENQKYAWSFFDRYLQVGVKPDTHTFTIFLNGTKKLYVDRANEIQADRKLTSKARVIKLYEIQAQMVQIAETVLLKLVEAALPPVPPKKEDVQLNPELLKKYRTASYFHKVEIDRVFLSTLVSCFTNNAFGTGASGKKGPNYTYLQRALFYLQAWVPETRDLTLYVLTGKVEEDTVETPNLHSIPPQREVESKTLERMMAPPVPKELQPGSVLQELAYEDLNPQVVFPPWPFSKNKTAATYSNKTKPLVDFTRVPLEVIRKEQQRRLYVKTQGKEGVKHPPQNISKDKYHINKFLLRHFLESLIKMGRFNEFHLAVWYALNKWGGVPIDLALVHKNGFEHYPYAEKHILAPQSGTAVRFVKNNQGCPDTSEQASSDLIDVVLLEDFIYKIEDNFPKASSPTRFALELFAAACYGSSSAIDVREKTFNSIFSILNREIYSYNDLNRATSLASNVQRNVSDNTPKKSLSVKQLKDLSENVAVLIKCIVAWIGMKRPAAEIIKSLDNLMNRIYDVTWLDAPETHPNCYKVHEQMVFAAIPLYIPKKLVKPDNTDLHVKAVTKSVDYVYDQLKRKAELNTKEKKLFVYLQDIFKLDGDKAGVEEKLRALQWKIYRLGEGRDTTAENVLTEEAKLVKNAQKKPDAVTDATKDKESPIMSGSTSTSD